MLIPFLCFKKHVSFLFVKLLNLLFKFYLSWKGAEFRVPWRWRSGFERSHRKQEVGFCLNPSRDIPKSYKQVVTSPLLNARQ